MNAFVEELRSALRSRHPLLYIQSSEEERVLSALEALAVEAGGGARLSTWSCITGLETADAAADAELRDPAAALAAILRDPHPGFYIFKDLSQFIERPEVIRALRNAYYAFAGEARTRVVIVSPELSAPPMLDNELCILRMGLPAPSELLAHCLGIQEQYPGLAMPEEVHSQIALSLRGLTLKEAGHVMHRVFGAGSAKEEDILGQVFDAKRMLLRNAGFLEFIPVRLDADDIGGMEILKDWLLKRRELFTQRAVDEGLPIPKGMLIMGISGCGKSLCAKAVASLWHVPLFRLDMNLVFSGIYGTPEAAFHRALSAIESIAPAVLWIDEIENALGMTTDNVSAEQSLTFSSFLTWMQERPPLIFVAATANRIESLPAEVIRKGRFDEVFFCDLPTRDERREIFRVHLRANGVDPEAVDVDRLLHSTDGWSGAEIEQAVVAGRIDAQREGRPPTLEDIKHHTIRMVPLSRTMAEQIKGIRDWSYQRATRTSKEPPRSMIPQEY